MPVGSPACRCSPWRTMMDEARERPRISTAPSPPWLLGPRDMDGLSGGRSPLLRRPPGDGPPFASCKSCRDGGRETAGDRVNGDAEGGVSFVGVPARVGHGWACVAAGWYMAWASWSFDGTWLSASPNRTAPGVDGFEVPFEYCASALGKLIGLSGSPSGVLGRQSSSPLLALLFMPEVRRGNGDPGGGVSAGVRAGDRPRDCVALLRIAASDSVLAWREPPNRSGLACRDRAMRQDDQSSFPGRTLALRGITRPSSIWSSESSSESRSYCARAAGSTD